ncbi:hypothetical protein PFMALIP_00008, partial [Plasmodium falciparum MaliPS096_E11]
HNENKPYTKSHTAITALRVLSKCELYVSNYDNDPDLESVEENFDIQTSQRFEEYDERMKEKQQKCKEQCDKEIQKIILKDKMEKELMDKFATLHTDIQNDAIPTCFCEKSLANKVEKGCLRCGGILCAAMPELGSIGGSFLYALNAWKPTAITAAKDAALAEATDAATKAGMNAVRLKIEGLLASFTKEQGLVDLRQIVTSSTYNNGPVLVESARKLINDSYKIAGINRTTSFQNTALTSPGELYVGDFAKVGATTYDTTFASQKPLLEAAKVDAVNATYASFQIAIIASIVAILVIVLAMVIIYLILRYRRKKKMKRKLQYIKLLKE